MTSFIWTAQHKNSFCLLPLVLQILASVSILRYDTVDNVSEFGNGRWVRRTLTETLRKREARKETEAEKGRSPRCGLKHHSATDVHHPLTEKESHWRHLGISLDKDDGGAGAGMRGVDPKRTRRLDPISWPPFSFLYNLSTLTSQLL